MEMENNAMNKEITQVEVEGEIFDLYDEAANERQGNFELYAANNFANAIKKTVSGEVARMDDVSPVPHTVKVKVTCPEGVDPTSVTVTAEGNTYTPNADGTVDGVVSVSPTMTLLTDTAGVTIEVEYNQDSNSVREGLRGDITELDKSLADISEIVHGNNLLDISKIQRETRIDDNGNIFQDADAATACLSDYIPVKSGDCIQISITNDEGNRIGRSARRVMGYNENKEFIGMLATYVHSLTLRAEGLAYVRLQLYTAEVDRDMQIEFGDAKTNYEPYKQQRILRCDSVLAKSETSFMSPVSYVSDFTLVDGRIWGFYESTDVGVMNGLIKVFSIDEANKTAHYMLDTTATPTAAISRHDFGHCNTVDYCPETKCLVFGNGGGEYNTDGKFYVIPNANKLLENETNAIADLAIEYDCTAYKFGDKLNACWGYDNFGRHDIVIIITNDNKNIRFVQLGKGGNNLGLGRYIDGKGDDEFNGSFKVCKEYTLDDGTTHPNNTNCNQGSDYYGGKLYVSVGHEPHRHWEISFQHNGVASFVEVYEPFHDDGGNTVSGATEGMCVTDNYIINNECGTFLVGGAHKNMLCIKRRI